ncbi:MAG: tRNA (adenosine(37)-N6)-threonylcarbamoyltransferase complex transferase subunit TsaD [Acidimicrobiales bacterium]
MTDLLRVEYGLTLVGIETSCDETAVALLRDGEISASVVVAQNDIHRDFGGVVPELASRAHSRAITRAIREVMEYAEGVSLDGIAVTSGPGLAGPLMVGVAAAKALSLSKNVPLIGVDHMEGHLFAATLVEPVALPAIVLLVSGGHTELLAIDAPGIYRYLGGTIDDAAGEAFDKAARMLGLGFPGGPEIERLAATSVGPVTFTFPRALAHHGLDLSFSGPKTAVVNYLRAHRDADPAHVAYAFQEAVVDALIIKLRRAIKEGFYRSIVIGGGVAANTRLREETARLAEQTGLRGVIPPRALCTDNGAMIAAAGAFRLARGDVAPLALGIDPARELAAK